MIQFTYDSIQIQEIYNQVVNRNSGATTLFIGTVRELTGEKQTLYLNYEAYEPMAIRMLNNIKDEIVRRYPKSKVSIIHRLGRLEITDIAIAIAVSTPHRADAYEANRFAIERIKEMVPIWKQEFWADGTQWMGSQNEQIPVEDLQVILNSKRSEEQGSNAK